MNTPEQIEALVKAAQESVPSLAVALNVPVEFIALHKALAPFLPKPEKVYTMLTFQQAWVLSGTKIDNTGRQYIALETSLLYQVDYNALRELTATDAPEKKAREWWISKFKNDTLGIAYASKDNAAEATNLEEIIHVREVLP